MWPSCEIGCPAAGTGADPVLSLYVWKAVQPEQESRSGSRRACRQSIRKVRPDYMRWHLGGVAVSQQWRHQRLLGEVSGVQG